MFIRNVLAVSFVLWAAASQAASPPLTVFGISGDQCSHHGCVFSLTLNAGGDPVTGQYEQVAAGKIREVKTAMTKTGQRLLVGISAENGRPHLIRLDETGRAREHWIPIGQGTATAFCVGEDANGKLLLFCLSGDGGENNRKAFKIGIGDDGLPVGNFELLAQGTLAALAYGKTSTNQRVLLGISAENGRPHVLRLDADSRAMEHWVPVGRGTATAMCLGEDAAGKLLLFCVSGDDGGRAFKIGIGDDGLPVGNFELLAQGTLTMLKYCKSKSGQRVLVGISAENGRPHVLRLDADSRAMEHWVPVGEGTAVTIVLVATEEGSPLLVAVSGNDRQVYAHKFNEAGSPIGSFYRLGPGTATGLANNNPAAWGAAAAGAGAFLGGAAAVSKEVREWLDRSKPEVNNNQANNGQGGRQEGGTGGGNSGGGGNPGIPGGHPSER